MLTSEDINDLTSTLKLLSDPMRLRILDLIAAADGGEVCVGDLCRALGQSQPSVSHHLSLCRVSGMLRSRRQGKHVLYSIPKPTKKLFTAIKATVTKQLQPA
jgi:ArsR family transcriptional regulator